MMVWERSSLGFRMAKLWQIFVQGYNMRRNIKTCSIKRASSVKQKMKAIKRAAPEAKPSTSKPLRLQTNVDVNYMDTSALNDSAVDLLIRNRNAIKGPIEYLDDIRRASSVKEKMEAIKRAASEAKLTTWKHLNL
uniref:Uncharacterized protein n=1 Tax=Clastoptera arizonana TaxID=38151 RepID=A0A1B6BZ49_9HEMI